MPQRFEASHTHSQHPGEAVPGTRLETAAQVQRKVPDLLTTSFVDDLDVLGNVIRQTELGVGTGATQSRLSRVTDFHRNASGFVTRRMTQMAR